MVSTMSSVEVATEGRDETQGKLNSKHDKMGTLIVGANISCTHPKNIRKLRDTKSLGNILNRSEYSTHHEVNTEEIYIEIIKSYVSWYIVVYR